MAYAAVASLSHTINLLLNYHNHSISPQFRDQIISLQKHIIFLQSFLEDAPDRTNKWEETMREVADRAEDIIQLLLSDSLLETTSSGSSKSNYDLHELERVTEEIESVADRVKGKRIESSADSDEELMKIISRLRGGSSALEIIPIVGMGGIGKTTLARNAYNHPLIMEHFDIRGWCTASSDDDWRRIILDLLHSPFTNMPSPSPDELMVRVYQTLYQRRYLFVIDDIWSLEVWDDLKFVLQDDGNGSRVMLTTRVMDLAESAGRIHHMRFLDEDKTWDLFREIIFEGDPCPINLEQLGKMIARSCRGHPLSIEVVSGILAADQTEATWEDVSENMKIASESDELALDRILSLSYIYLPHHLRPCFLYLGIFPENQEIRVSKLIKLWVAEGFLSESESKSKRFEETGEENVEDLVRRNLVSVSRRKCNGGIKSIAIHDVMRYVCRRQAYTDSFNLHVSSFDRQEFLSLRRVSYLFHGDDFFEGVYGSTIRTLIVSCLEDSQVGVMRLSIGNVRLLRILDLSNIYKYDLAKEVFELFHLRYLAFQWGNKSISEAISKLQNLQTLIICPRKGKYVTIGKLPQGIWRMPQLRHLVMFPSELPREKYGTSALENLQTLSVLVDFICSIENLKMIPNLKKLAIYTDKINNLRNAVVEDYQHDNLKYLQKLEILKINGHNMRSCNAFPPTLKKLYLIDVWLWKDMKIVGLLPNLQVLKLKNCSFSHRTWETNEGGFSQLTYLLIDYSNLENWITESSHFPRLKSLVLHSCMHLLEVPNDIGRISTLELVKLDNENQSLLSSVKQIQKDRQSLGDDHLQIILEKKRAFSL